ncbi:substrate-binding domain-containing protein [Luteolibacter pohnpeiensis]|uniref:Substrate-binding domain-containing protein n=1 Tax=Luteolibacter pohnpeiensis TaxID=454153 RepID=A0A934VTT0_9BACT|nr:substrate-binding domain-containing protein [Luteolibacter pohnpeiensis]MBK1881797.1 substrate-binding domain-containing protein [Luteolibacter pohnpeiensis]
MKPPGIQYQPVSGMVATKRPSLKSRDFPAAAAELPTRRIAARSAILVTLTMGDYDPRIHLGFIRAGRELGWNIQEIREFSQDFTTPWKLEAGDCSIRLFPADGFFTKESHGRAVSLPFAAAGAAAAKHLIALNYPHLAFFYSHPDQIRGRMFESFVRCCAEAGKEVIPLAGDLQSGLEACHRTLEMLKSLPLPCAVFAASDEDAAALINAAATIGISVPSQLAVLGCGDHEIARAKCHTGLCSIDLNHELAAYTTAKLFHHLLSGDAIAETNWTVKPGKLIERESSGKNGSHPGVSHVLARIEKDYSEPLAVPQLAREVGMSVRTLQRMYGAMTGSVIGEDLLIRRLNAASKLLKNSDLKLEAIAHMVGLGNANRLCRLFRARFGCTPNQCRMEPGAH